MGDMAKLRCFNPWTPTLEKEMRLSCKGVAERQSRTRGIGGGLSGQWRKKKDAGKRQVDDVTYEKQESRTTASR